MSRPQLNPPDDSQKPADGVPFRTGEPAWSPSLSDGRPRWITVIALIVAAEGAALLVAAGLQAKQLLFGPPVLSFWGAVFLLVLLLAFSSWVFTVGHFLFRGYRWPRAGALVAQLFALTIGFPALTGGYPWLGLALLVPAATAIVLLFDKRVVKFASRVGGSPPAL